MAMGTETSDLRRVVQEAIDQGRLGGPKFLRCIARADGPEQLDSALSELVSLAEGWFGSSPRQRYRPAGDHQVYLTEILKWPGGEGALLTVTAVASEATPRLDLMLVGSRGVLYHEA